MTMQQFVARQSQLQELFSFLHPALESHGQVAFVVGEAGAGKTALITEFARRAQDAHTDLTLTIGNCNAQTGFGDPYLPFREILAQLTGDVEAKQAQGSITAENARRLQGLVRWSCAALLEFGPDLINILVPGSALIVKGGKFVLEQAGWSDKFKQLVERKLAGPAESALDQSHIFEQYTKVLKALAKKAPLVLVLDDLQWADGASTSLLFHLGRRIAGSRILVLGAYRPEEVKLGRGGERHPLDKVLTEFKRQFGDVQVDLDQIEEDETRQFVDALLELEPNCLGEGFRQALVRHTGGHPLFAVELLRAMKEQGNLEKDAKGRWVEGARLDWDALPPRVEGVIEERIGRLAEELRDTSEVASVEGEKFTAEVVARVRGLDAGRTVRSLNNELDRKHHLVVSEGSRRLGRQPLSSYRFRHNLFQKYLYDNLDAARRVYLHEDVGKVLETLYGDQAAEIAVQLARHFHEAGLAEKAVEYLRQAGERALRVSANEEAISYLNRGLDLLPALLDDSERVRQELNLLVALGPLLIATKGYAAEEVEHAYSRARELCGKVEENPQLLSVLSGLCTYYMCRPDFEMGLSLAEQVLKQSQRTQHVPYQAAGLCFLGGGMTWQGELESAREHLERSIDLADEEQCRRLVFLIGLEPGLFSLTYLAYVLWLLGYPDQGLQRVNEAVARAQELDNPFCLAKTYCVSGVHHFFRREYEIVREQAEEAIALSAEYGLPQWMAEGVILRGWALVQQGMGCEEHCAEMHQAMDAWRATGAEMALPYYLLLLAETHGKLGQIEQGLGLLSEAMTLTEDNGEYWIMAELCRLKGGLLLAQSEGIEVAEAEEWFQQAITVARQQKAKSLELRAVMSLSRLWQTQGKRADARQMLAAIYGWFTEGFDTADLQQARAMLDELAGSD